MSIPSQTFLMTLFHPIVLVLLKPGILSDWQWIEIQHFCNNQFPKVHRLVSKSDFQLKLRLQSFAASQSWLSPAQGSPNYVKPAVISAIHCPSTASTSLSWVLTGGWWGLLLQTDLKWLYPSVLTGVEWEAWGWAQAVTHPRDAEWLRQSSALLQQQQELPQWHVYSSHCQLHRHQILPPTQPCASTQHSAFSGNHISKYLPHTQQDLLPALAMAWKQPNILVATDWSQPWARVGDEQQWQGVIWGMFLQHSTESLLSLAPEHQVLASASGRIPHQKSQHFSPLQRNNMWLENCREKCTRTWATQEPVTAQPCTAMPTSPSPFRAPVGFPWCPEELYKVPVERWTLNLQLSQSWGTKGELLTQNHTFVLLWLPTLTLVDTHCRAHRFDTEFCFIPRKVTFTDNLICSYKASTGSVQFGCSNSCQTYKYTVGTEQIGIENEPSTGNLGIFKNSPTAVNTHWRDSASLRCSVPYYHQEQTKVQLGAANTQKSISSVTRNFSGTWATSY